MKIMLSVDWFLFVLFVLFVVKFLILLCVSVSLRLNSSFFIFFPVSLLIPYS